MWQQADGWKLKILQNLGRGSYPHLNPHLDLPMAYVNITDTQINSADDEKTH